MDEFQGLENLVDFDRNDHFGGIHMTTMTLLGLA